MSVQIHVVKIEMKPGDDFTIVTPSGTKLFISHWLGGPDKGAVSIYNETLHEEVAVVDLCR